MIFTVRLTLGAVLVLITCLPIKSSPIDAQQSSTEKNASNQIQKTEITPSNGTKLFKSVPYDEESKKEIEGRSFDVEKYYSNDFHNKNNIYNLTVSKDTQKFIHPDYEFETSSTSKQEPTTHKHNYYEHDSNESFDLTTPKSQLFDSLYQQTVDSVDQQLEHLEDSSQEASHEAPSSEHHNVEQLLNKTKSNETTAILNYIKYRNLISNDSAINNNSIHKDQVVESGTQLDFESAFNHTKIIDENGDRPTNNTIRKEDEPKATTYQPTQAFTTPPSGRRIVLKPKPSQSPVLSNRIEQEKSPKRTPPTTTPPKPVDQGQKEVATNLNLRTTPIDITKRGSLKFADYNKHLTTLRPKTTTVVQKSEELVQENQIVPVSVQAPKSLSKEDGSGEVGTSKQQAKAETIATSARPETTTFVDGTTDGGSSSTDIGEVTSTIGPETSTLVIESDDGTTLMAVLDDFTTISDFTTTEIPPTTTAITENVNSESKERTTENVARTSKGFKFDEDVTSTTEPLTTEPVTAEATTPLNTELPATTESVTEVPVEYTTFVEATTIVTTTEKEAPPVVTSAKVVLTETTVSPAILSFSEPTTTSTVSFSSSSSTSTVALPSSSKSTVDASTSSETTTHSSFEPPTSETPAESTVIIYTIAPNESSRKTNITTTTKDPNQTTTPNELNDNDNHGPNGGTIAAIVISSIGAVCLILLAGLLIIMRKRQNRFNYGQRCRPVNLDDYSMDNISVYNSVRRKGAARASKRSYGNPAFEDPVSLSHPLNYPALGRFVDNVEDMRAEFDDIPQITARTNELPEGCDTKNRYANVIPLPETRVFLQTIDGYPNSDYINANYVTGPKNTKGYYIACQAPMQSTVDDFWRMIWEQECKVILMLTHHFENGIEKCTDYLPPSEVLDCHRLFGDFQVTLKKREVKEKYVISSLQLKNMVSSSWREVTHFWYMGWPEKGVPAEANSLIAFLIEARSYMKSASINRKEITNGNLSNGTGRKEVSPVVVHCSPGTGRTGVAIACDLAIREFEQTRLVDVPKTVYKIRRDRANAVQTKDQYMFIYKVINLYATKLTGGALD